MYVFEAAVKCASFSAQLVVYQFDFPRHVNELLRGTLA